MYACGLQMGRREHATKTPFPAAGGLAGVPEFDQMSLPFPYADTRSVLSTVTYLFCVTMYKRLATV